MRSIFGVNKAVVKNTDTPRLEGGHSPPRAKGEGKRTVALRGRKDVFKSMSEDKFTALFAGSDHFRLAGHPQHPLSWQEPITKNA